jgi:hypothetical protein
MLLVLASCLKPKEKPVPEDRSGLCRIIKLTSQDADSSYNYTITYKYDSLGRLAERVYYIHDLFQNPVNPNTDGVKTLYKYNANGKLSGSNTGTNTWTELEYINEQISKYRVYKIESGDTSTWFYDFSYQGDHISQISLIENNVSKGKVFILSFVGDNLSRIEQLKDGSIVEWHEYDLYDDTVNLRQHFIPEIFTEKLDIGSFIKMSASNPTHRNQGLDQPTSGWFLNYSYEVDEKIWIRLVTKDHWSDIIEYRYEWDCP